MRSALFAIVLGALSGCGSVYIPTDVKTSGSDQAVHVVVLSAETVRAANAASSYAPRDLPSQFNETAGFGSGLREAGALPESPIDQQAAPPTVALSVPPETASGPYRIGVGDMLGLTTGATTIGAIDGSTGSVDRRQSYMVQDDGAITLPSVGRIPVQGKTVAEAEAEIFKQLVARQIDPSFSVEVSGFNSQRISVGGAVRTPALVPVTLAQPRLNEVLAQAGGLADADPEYSTIRLYRDGTLYQIPLQDYLGREDLQRLVLADGDSLFVDTSYELDRAQAYFEQQLQLADIQQRNRAQAIAELQTEIGIRRSELEESRSNFRDQLELDAVDRDYVYVIGEVDSPIRFALPFGQQASLADAMAEAGGIAPSTGDPSQIYVLRSDSNGMVTAWHLDGSNAVNYVLATQFDLRPDDVVFVAEQPITRWNRVVQQIVPSLISSGVAAASR